MEAIQKKSNLIIIIKFFIKLKIIIETKPTNLKTGLKTRIQKLMRIDSTILDLKILKILNFRAFEMRDGAPRMRSKSRNVWKSVQSDFVSVSNCL